MGAYALLVDKPKGLTSFQVVESVRKKMGVKVGHTGTLDPIATGLLILLLGEATRYANLFVNLPKTYEVKVKLGEITNTYDAEGKVLEVRDVNVSCEDIRTVLEEFKGKILQKPPPFSAKKVGGKRAYKLARRGERVELKEVEVQVFRSELYECHLPYFSARFEVSSGTYIRSLVHEMGLRLGCGAHIAELRRTHVGKFDVSMAINYQRLLTWEDLSGCLVPVDQALDFLQRLDIPQELWEKIKKGASASLKMDLQFRTFVRLYVKGEFVGVALIEANTIKPYRLMPL